MDTSTQPCGAKVSQELADALRGVRENLDLRVDKERVAIVQEFGNGLNSYSIFEKVPVDQKRRIVELAAKDYVLDRFMGSMCGMGVGDALGHPFEFEPAQDQPKDQYFDLANLEFHNEANAFRLKRGQWTDDASMGLCMADSLILRREYDGSDIRVRFWCWWNRGYNNAFRKDPSRNSSVGLGGNISKSLSAISALRRGDKPPAVFEAVGEDAGNGSLMRFTPIALFFHSAPLEVVYHFSRQSSYTTHPGIIAAEACALLAHIIYCALHRPPGEVDAKAFLDEVLNGYLESSGLSKKSGWGYDQMKWLVTSNPVNDTESCWNWRQETQSISATLRARGNRYNGYPVSSGYFGSYSLDGLALALWAVYNSRSFDEAVTKSVNLCGDADSHGSICGQIAGALYGYNTIHPQFKAWLNDWDDHDFALRGLLLYQAGCEYVPPPMQQVSTRTPLPDPDDELPPQPMVSRANSALSPSGGDNLDQGDLKPPTLSRGRSDVPTGSRGPGQKIGNPLPPLNSGGSSAPPTDSTGSRGA